MRWQSGRKQKGPQVNLIFGFSLFVQEHGHVDGHVHYLSLFVHFSNMIIGNFVHFSMFFEVQKYEKNIFQQEKLQFFIYLAAHSQVDAFTMTDEILKLAGAASLRRD